MVISVMLCKFQVQFPCLLASFVGGVVRVALVGMVVGIGFGPPKFRLVACIFLVVRIALIGMVVQIGLVTDAGVFALTLAIHNS